jgi:hypothetical protein
MTETASRTRAGSRCRLCPFASVTVDFRLYAARQPEDVFPDLPVPLLPLDFDFPVCLASQAPKQHRLDLEQRAGA